MASTVSTSGDMDCGLKISEEVKVGYDDDLYVSPRIIRTVVSIIFILVATVCILANVFGLTRLIKHWKNCQVPTYFNLMLASCILAISYLSAYFPTVWSTFVKADSDRKVSNVGLIPQFLENLSTQLMFWTLLVLEIYRIVTLANGKMNNRRVRNILFCLTWLFSLVLASLFSSFDCFYYDNESEIYRELNVDYADYFIISRDARITRRSFRCTEIQSKLNWNYMEMTSAVPLFILIILNITSFIFLIIKTRFLTDQKSVVSLVSKQCCGIFCIYKLILLLPLVRNYTSFDISLWLLSNCSHSNPEMRDALDTLKELNPLLFASLLLIILSSVPLFLHFAGKFHPKSSFNRLSEVGSSASASMVSVHIDRPPRNSIVKEKSIIFY